MKTWEFRLNNQSVSALTHRTISFPAFSGLAEHVNRQISACIPNKGPIPPGEYYIFNRQSGGTLGWFRDLFNGRRDWFALYANDGVIDDETWCEQVKRGQFRLHPKGPSGISHGCIVLKNSADFQQLSHRLRTEEGYRVEGIDLLAWGKVVVK